MFLIDYCLKLILNILFFGILWIWIFEISFRFIFYYKNYIIKKNGILVLQPYGKDIELSKIIPESFLIKFTSTNKAKNAFLLSLIITAIVFFISIIFFGNINYLHNNIYLNIIYFPISIDLFFLKHNFLLLGVDGISLFLVLLTTFLFLICCFIAENIKKYVTLFFTLFLFLEIFILLAFLVLDFLWFYVFFEALLIPMFLIIGIWGSRKRKLKAANYFLFFAFFGSLFMLIGIFIIYNLVGSTSWYANYVYNYDIYIQKILWFLFFIGFAIKVPLWPFHIWLPEAHVEAPTIGSIILAGLLLKLGGYGFLRFVLPIFTDATKFFLPFVITLCVIGIVYASLTTLRQIDMKRIIAYSSVAHMSYGMLGIFSLNYYGVLGGIIIMLAHGLISSALFYLVGILYETYGTRIIKYYGGIVQIMPLYAFFLFFFTIANMGLPGLFLFVGEFLVTVGILINNTFATVISVLSSVFTIGYMVLLYNRIIFGSLKIQNIKFFKDITYKDFIILSIFTYFTLLFGIYPQILIKFIEYSILDTQRLYDI